MQTSTKGREFQDVFVLIKRDELARKVLEGEITSLDDLDGVLRSMIKDGVETVMKAGMTGFLGHDCQTDCVVSPRCETYRP